jgi:integrase
MELRLRGREAGPVFTTRNGTHLAKSNFVRQDWTDLLAAAKVRSRKFHALRHTHARRQLADGVDPAEVAKRLGERLETVMRVYAHWIPTAGRDTAARVIAIYGAETEEAPGLVPGPQGALRERWPRLVAVS